MHNHIPLVIYPSAFFSTVKAEYKSYSHSFLKFSQSGEQLNFQNNTDIRHLGSFEVRKIQLLKAPYNLAGYRQESLQSHLKK